MRLLVWYLMIAGSGGIQTYIGGPYATEAACLVAKAKFEHPAPSGLVVRCVEKEK